MTLDKGLRSRESPMFLLLPFLVWCPGKLLTFLFSKDLAQKVNVNRRKRKGVKALDVLSLAQEAPRAAV